MKRVLKPSGSLYLHCDPKASHYLKMVLDTIFGADNFRNEIVWCYSGGGVPRDDFPRKHDIIFRYSMSETVTFNVERKPYGKHIKSGKRATDLGGTRSVEYNKKGTPINDWWDDINPLINWHKERLGYPTQKPLKLLERILKISSNEGDFVLDPFCGCGTTVNAAESLNRQWIGIDISQFSTGLIRKRLLDNFGELRRQDITRIGVPSTTREAKSLFKTSPFEFEKWVCGAVGAEGMFHDPGTPGPDGGVDGVIPFYFSEPGLENDKVEKTFAIVQVKGGNVSPDNVKALSTTVRETGAKCGVFVCFQDYMNTVNNNKERKQLKDWTGEFPFIQGFSIEQLVKGELPTLPGLSRAL